MQTFLPFSLYKDSAKCLDYRRLGKQRIECLELLKCLSIGPYQKRETVIHNWRPASELEYNNLPKINVRKTPWYNHPAAKMWMGYENFLVSYGMFICSEWCGRGYMDNCLEKIKSFYDYTIKENKYPEWINDERLYLSHKSNLIRKNPQYYRPIFGTDIPDNLPYFWPI